MSRAEPFWLYLHFPLLPLELCYTRTSSEPAALCATRQNTLLLCNQAAMAQGVKPGLAIAAAVALCPTLQLFSRRSDDQMHEQLQALALWAGRFSARVALGRPSGLLLEIASMADYFGSLTHLYDQVMKAAQELAFSVTAATGHTPECARLLSLTGGCFAAHPEASRQQLQQLAITALDLPPRALGQLNGLGLRQLQQLLALPRSDLAERFGPSLMDYLDRLTGHKSDPPHYVEPPPQFCRRVELEHELENSQALLFPLRRLLAELEGFLRVRQLLAERLLLTLQQREGEHTLSLSHSSGEYRQSAWLELWRLKLESLLLDQPVISLQLDCPQLRPCSKPADDLFQQAAGESPQQLLSRLQTRLGNNALYTPQIRADHRPERQQDRATPAPDLQSTLQSPIRPATPKQQPDSSAQPPQRPGWLFHAPHPLNGTPTQQQITLLRGPERIVSGWWDSNPIRRDYYVGQWPDGRIGWLFCNDQKRWYQHGWFG